MKTSHFALAVLTASLFCVGNAVGQDEKKAESDAAVVLFEKTLAEAKAGNADAMVFLGTMIAPAAAWDLGDIALGIVILPNLLALIMLSGKTRQLMDSYFERQPWLSQPHE